MSQDGVSSRLQEKIVCPVCGDQHYLFFSEYYGTKAVVCKTIMDFVLINCVEDFKTGGE